MRRARIRPTLDFPVPIKPMRTIFFTAKTFLLCSLEVFYLLLITFKITQGLFQTVTAEFFAKDVSQLEGYHRLANDTAGGHGRHIRALDRRGLLLLSPYIHGLHRAHQRRVRFCSGPEYQ